MAAASADPNAKPTPYERHISLVNKFRSAPRTSDLTEQILAQHYPDAIERAMRALLCEPFDAATESARWETLMEAVMTSRTGSLSLPFAAEAPMSLLDVLLASAYVSDGRTYPQALCTAMISAEVSAVRLSDTLVVDLLGVLEACTSYWKAANNGESCAAFYMLLADALYTAGRTRDAAAAVVGAIESAPLEVYPWAVLCDLLAEQPEADAHVNVAGVGRVDLATARAGLVEVRSKQVIGGTVRWSTVAIVVGAVAVGVGVLLRYRRK
uniref:Uncharacterized protein n=1 Tax=Neobodo designis TaxID=312471 RepID=A0A7S1M698_NEODS